MISILKRYTAGFLVGVLYALIHFVLIAPIMRDNLLGIILWGVQGICFVIFWDISSFFVQKENRNQLIPHLIRGGFGGIGIALIPALFATSRRYLPSGTPVGRLLDTISLDLILFCFGCVFAGIVIGALIHRTSSTTLLNEKQN